MTLKTYTSKSNPILQMRTMFPTVTHTHVVVSAMPKAKIYALVDVVFLRIYMATTNRFLGMPKTHIRTIILLDVENCKQDPPFVESLAIFLSEFKNVCSEVDRL